MRRWMDPGWLTLRLLPRVPRRALSSLPLGLFATLPLAAQQTVIGGPTNDYQAAVVVPAQDPVARILVFERLDASALGDLWLTRSVDSGANWTTQVRIVGTAANERHASLVQTDPSGYALFHLSNASGGFRIHRATSIDGATYSASTPIDLGWPTAGEINPQVVRRADGRLLLCYHRLSGAAYIAASADAGASWDTLRTPLSPSTAALPRLAVRESDGLHLVVYQTGSNPVTLWVKTSFDASDWSAPARMLTVDGNNHDAWPLVLSDGRLAILWARVIDGAFQIVSTVSSDGIAWTPPRQQTARAGLHNVQPHALPAAASGVVELYWGAAQVGGLTDLDIVRSAAVEVAPATTAALIHADGFEGGVAHVD